jgi:hypothetical protein
MDTPTNSVPGIVAQAIDPPAGLSSAEQIAHRNGPPCASRASLNAHAGEAPTNLASTHPASDRAVEDAIVQRSTQRAWTLDLSGASDEQLAAMALPPWHPEIVKRDAR